MEYGEAQSIPGDAVSRRRNRGQSLEIDFTSPRSSSVASVNGAAKGEAI
jgi:hypothetical protein